jgi:hypothetical protein
MAHPVLRIAIIDGERARTPTAKLRTIGSLDSVSMHLPSRDIGTDKPGRSFGRSASARADVLSRANGALRKPVRHAIARGGHHRG